ncbi:hypothetical protein F5X97DRAFT_292412 [Nemania serpens]|nr:hypothetical protein F5X97DRAFT_292412 [Nemania serpens]
MPLQIPHPTTPLHLYRHLLRESTYLPALCRPWITSRIKDRFRDRRQTNPATAYVKQAHKSLRYLRSANAGHVKRLERLCFMATGRVGKRRRILASTQLAAPTSADTAEAERSRVETVPDDPTTDSAAVAPQQRHDWLDNWSLDMISALAKSQVAQQASNWPQSMRRVVDTQKIEKGTNAFGRPYNPKLRRNKLKKHWAGILLQLLPPLPQGEWDHLASLVQGGKNVDELRVPGRRPVAHSLQSSGHDLADEPWDWRQHVLKPARVIERGSNRQQKSLAGNEDQDPRGHGRPIGVRVIGSRKLQRIYGRIWNMSPIIRPSHGGKGKKWSVSWGENEQKISAPSKRDLLFFQGVANNGQLLAEAGASSKGGK